MTARRPRRPPGGRRSRSCAGCSRRAPTPTARSARPPPGSTPATAPSPSGSPTAPCSASGRSTTRSTRSGSRPAEELDPPVLAALRIAGYELGWSEAPPHAVVNDAVELVRSAGLRHATGFTNAVARRLAEGLPALLASLPPGPLAESYPDWIYELWRARLRPRGGARADARAERAGRARRPLGRCRSGRRPTSRAPTGSSAGRSRAARRAASGRAEAPSSRRWRSAPARASGSSMPARRPARRRRCSRAR